jgi:hypothetical protein
LFPSCELRSLDPHQENLSPTSQADKETERHIHTQKKRKKKKKENNNFFLPTMFLPTATANKACE